MKQNKNLDAILKNNTFLINSCICLIVLLCLCYLGISSPLKKTYASNCNGKEYFIEDPRGKYDYDTICVDSNYSALYGQWRLNDSLSFSNITWTEMVGLAADVIQLRYEVPVYGQLLPEVKYSTFKDYRVSFDVDGEDYESMVIFADESTGAYSLHFDTSYTEPVEDKTQIPNYPYKKDMSADGRMHAYSSNDGWVSNTYHTIDFGAYDNSDVNSEFTSWFIQNAEPVTKTLCVYDSNTSTFKWTNEYVSGYQPYTIYEDESSCKENNKMYLTIKDSSGSNIQDCTSGTCASKTTEIKIKLSPGTYQLDDTTKLKYKIQRDGYKLTGWVAEPIKGDLTIKQANDTISFGHYYYAWTIEPVWKRLYTVTYHANGGNNDIPSSQTKVADEPLTLSNTIPTKSEYKFIGWNTKANGTGTSYASGSQYTGNESITLYAQWTEKKIYTINYNVNGGSGGPTNKQTKTEGTPITLSSIKPTRSGFEFIGWNTKVDGTGTTYASGVSYSTDANVTLYAQWVKPYEIASTYKVDETNKYITVDIGTTKIDFEKNVTLGTGYQVTTDYKTIDNKETLYTGGKMQIKKTAGNVYAEYSAVVLGDINGDGSINSQDYIEIYRHLSSKYTDTLVNEYLLAADYDSNDSVNSADYVEIYNYLREKNNND